MALAKYVLSHTNNNPDSVAAAPTVSETIVAPDDNTFLVVIIGVTATTVTIVAPGNNGIGEPQPDKVLTGLTSTRRVIKVDRNYKDSGTGGAGVTFSQVTNVTAYELRTR